ncbi:uncharacterized protein LOC128258196 isoform X2 [Drosophila gunungcola]|uniref:uncharacterized protein LOC128258196 isoform X2 n=1 Tax=Drosophila gunungcola TaxID=103775 RepID=UPI0022E27453|nr:uncharacterized protein LOC128258196 isoform X2 [Drosophila gunungcola]
MKLFCLLFFSLIITKGTPNPKCPSEKICGNVSELMEVCILDETENCIRKYKSSCHMAIAGCLNRNLQFTDYSNEYCGMEGWLCEEPPYERWTLFFGQEAIGLLLHHQSAESSSPAPCAYIKSGPIRISVVSLCPSNESIPGTAMSSGSLKFYLICLLVICAIGWSAGMVRSELSRQELEERYQQTPPVPDERDADAEMDSAYDRLSPRPQSPHSKG